MEDGHRLERQRRVGQDETAPVRSQPPFQVRPAADGVHGFAFGDFLQQVARRRPRDPFQLQQVHSEARSDQVADAVAQRLQAGRVALTGRYQILVVFQMKRIEKKRTESSYGTECRQ